MSRLVGREFMDFISGISTEVTDVKMLLKLLEEKIAPVAAAAGLGCLYIEIQTQTRKHERTRMPEKAVIFENPQGHTDQMQEIRYSLQDRGYALFTAAPRKGTVWNLDMIHDFQMICQVLYIVVGRARTMDLLTRMIHTDDLTGIGNTAAFFRFVAEQAEKKSLTEFIVNFINIKHMKLHNSLYGESVGDNLFYNFAQKLKALAGDTGFAGRIGGDNFVAVIPAADEWDFLNAAKQMPVTILLENGESIEVSVSSRIGYCSPKTNSEIAEPLSNSNIAMMRAKQDNQPDIVQFTEEMREEMIREKAMLEAAPYALRNQNFVVYYQPKVDLDSKKLIGAEALVRWADGDRMLTPNMFIPLLEKSGFITQVDFFVFEHVCKAIQTWKANGIQPVCISSNFSRRHLSDPEFADKIEAIIKRYAVDPSLLEVEITESYAIDNMNQLRQFQERMHAIGVSVSIDDFGSGFASLSMLKKASADVVKIDKSIIDDISEEYAEDEIIAGHVIRMIRALNKQVVAEGVETEEQLSFLRSSGCAVVQGYFFDKPLTAVQFRERLLNKQY